MSDPAGRRPPPAASCLNCGDARSGRYCAQCGQNDRNYRRALVPMLWELVREAFEVDARVPRTLSLLLFKPGSLSREFSRNRRARYSSPVRLYIFASFVFFLVLSLTLAGPLPEGAVTVGVDGPEEAVSPEEAGSLVEADTVEVDPSQVVGDTELAALKAVLRPGQGQKVDDILRRPNSNWTRTAVAMFARLVSADDPFGPGEADFVLNEDSASADAADLKQPEGRDSALAAPQDPDRPGLLIRAFATSGVDFLHDPEVFQQRIIGNMPIAMFFLLPFLALALAICYFRKRRFFVEHLVFAMHVQIFVFLVLSVALLIPPGPIGRWASLALFLAPEVYYLVALRRFYRDGWIRTLIKGFFVQWLYVAVLAPGFLIALFLTA